eukprot:m.119542 g.119542  ORF g.119542 m.119542 type:complete len:267 (+) comp28743_c0_seq2:46-846(+)
MSNRRQEHNRKTQSMASRNFTPVNQIRLTNVAFVRYKKGGKRFELACYKNKIVGWRKKIETDLDEVLQTHTIFTNASRGQAAKQADLLKCFGISDEEKIVLEILAKGEIQVSKEERENSQSESFTEIAKMVVERCVNPETKKPYTIAQIEREMKEIHFAVRPEHSSKKQALSVITELKKTIPIERASLRIRILLPKLQAKSIKAGLASFITIETEEWAGDLELVCTIEPGHYRTILDNIQGQTKGKGVVEVLGTVDVTDTTDEALM